MQDSARGIGKKTMTNNIVSELRWRGLITDATEGLFDQLASHHVTFYCGFDPTESSLHVGHLAPLMTMARFQRFGHRPIAIGGGATGMIGDPSGRSEERRLLSPDQIRANLAGIEDQLRRILDFESRTNPARLFNNADWLAPFPMLDFLRDVGKYFNVNVMLGKESVRSRLERESGLSFTEFSYMLLQAYDFLYLHQHYGCELQIGGTDQWGNILAGMDLIRKVTGHRSYGLILPLVTKADGNKFGKTAGGAVWLSPQRTSPFRFYQFWFNTDDRDVISYLKRFTWLDQREIRALTDSLARNPEQRDAQRALAREVTCMVHGETALAQAEKATSALFGGDVRELSSTEIAEVFEGVATTELDRTALEGEGLPLTALLVETPLVESKSEARRMVKGGGIYLNNERVHESNYAVTLTDAVDGKLLVLRKGPKTYHIVRVLD